MQANPKPPRGKGNRAVMKWQEVKNRLSTWKQTLKRLQSQASTNKKTKTAQYNESFFGGTTMPTRQCPDHPGVQLARIEDNVRQCPLDGKIYDFVRGFTTENGTFHPGGSVQEQQGVPPGSIIIKKEAQVDATNHLLSMISEFISSKGEQAWEDVKKYIDKKRLGADSDSLYEEMKALEKIKSKSASIKEAQVSDNVHGFLYTHVLPHLNPQAEYARRVLNYKFSKPGVSLEQAVLDIKKADELAAMQKQEQQATAGIKGFVKNDK